MTDLIKNTADLEDHIQTLIKNHLKFTSARDATGSVKLRQSESGPVSLLRAIIGQQVSVASANAIWARLEAADMAELPKIARASHDDLRALGLSRQKASYVQNLATAGIDFDILSTLSDREIMEQLTAIKGIGKWTAEIYLMFALGRPDVFASGDLALQEATRILFELEKRPTEGQMRNIAVDWSPHQNAAAQLLWDYYHVIKDREGIGV